MVSASDSEHPNNVKKEANSESEPAKSRPDDQEAGEMNAPKDPLL